MTKCFICCFTPKVDNEILLARPVAVKEQQKEESKKLGPTGVDYSALLSSSRRVNANAMKIESLDAGCE